MKILFTVALSLFLPICACAGIVTLAWDADLWPDNVSYKVVYWRYHTSEFRYVTVAYPNVTLALPDDQTYCAQVTAITSLGQQSQPSDVVYFQTSPDDESQ